MTLFETARPIETLVRRAPLGLRFLDAHTGHAVVDSLRVTVRPVLGKRTPLKAVIGPSGIRSYHGIRGLEGWEAPGTGWTTAPDRSLGFVCTVVDLRSRYLPVTLPLLLPRPDPLLDVPLFGGAAYSAPGGWAVLRGRLGDLAAATGTGDDEDPVGADHPAAWTRLDAFIDDDLVGTGISDERGEFGLYFPYPPPVEAPLDLDPTGPPAPAVGPPAPAVGPPALQDRAWTVEIGARYSALATPASEDGPAAPELPSILEDQPAATVVRAWPVEPPSTKDEGPRHQVQLRYGSTAKVTTEERDALWIRPV